MRPTVTPLAHAHFSSCIYFPPGHLHSIHIELKTQCSHIHLDLYILYLLHKISFLVVS